MVRRAHFSNNKQRIFFEEVQKRSGLSTKELAQYCGVHARTYRAWKNEETTVSYNAVKKLSKRFSIQLNGVKILDQYWYTSKAAKKGAKVRLERHGNPGTLKGRMKGGKISQERRRQDPEKYREMGCIVRKEFPPLQPSKELAEMCGIIMGDGSVNDRQVKITLYREDDREFAQHVSNLSLSLFKERPSWSERNCVIELVLSGVNLIESLEKVGLRRGNKVKNQIGIPSWIRKKKTYGISCLRGLFDTDGCVYYHQKKSGTYMGWTYCSRSIPLRVQAGEILDQLDLKFSESGDSIWMYTRDDIVKYMDMVRSHNPKHVNKFQHYLENHM